MSNINEHILHRLLVEGIRRLRVNPILIDALFPNLNQNKLKDFKDYFLKTSIGIHFNHPHGEISTPSIVVNLKNETETDAFLGDFAGMSSYGNYLNPQMVYEELSKGHPASTNASTIEGNPPLIVSNLPVEEAYPSYVVVQDSDNELVQFFDTSPELVLCVIDGKGVGQAKKIKRISSKRIDIEDSFVIELDNTSKVSIRKLENYEAIDGEVSRIFPHSSFVKRLGGHFDTQYDISILCGGAGGQEKLIYLYNIVKQIFYINKTYIESQGLMNLKISGKDLVPFKEGTPSEIYERVLTIRFTAPYYVYDVENVPTKLKLVLTQDDPHTLDVSEEFVFEV